MKKLAFVALFSAALAAHAGSWKEHPLDGDPVNGEKLYKKGTKAKTKVDGAWINALSDGQAITGFKSGKGGFPRIERDNPLDYQDLVAFVRSRNTDLRDIVPDETTHVLVTSGTFDNYAVERLTERGGFESIDKSERSHRVFALYKVGEPGADLVRVRPKQNKIRDKLKPAKRIGYVVFMPLKDVRGGGYEIAFAVDNDIKITAVEVRGPDGDKPDDLNQAAGRLVGRGARGKYDGLRLVGAGKAVRELEKAVNSAFLLGMEAVYMYEVEERDYFAFDVD